MESSVLPVLEASQVGEVRRAVTALARRLGFGETEAGKVALVATEAADNLVKHARDGQVVWRAVESGPAVGIELLALDRGPGMADVGRCLQDGFSTAGTPGTGLGAVARLSAFVDLYSRRPTGTALLSRLWAHEPSAGGGGQLQVAGVCLPRAGEEVSGDAWAVAEGDGRTLLLVADGLGHGLHAADASRAAVRVFRANAGAAPVPILRATHQALRGTRGAAVAVAEVDRAARVLRYAGVGNIAGAVVSAAGGGASRSLVSHNGTVGHEARNFQEFTCPFHPGDLLVMHSDGLGSRWDLDAYPGLAGRDPALVAGVLYRDFQRGRDDVTVVVAREPGGRGEGQP
jgi:anti-sigma regulatory factor (Ser/Thr protein kinase)